MKLQECQLLLVGNLTISNRKGLIRDWNQYFDNSSPKGTDTISNKLDLLQYIQRINERMSKMEGFQ